MLIIYIFIYLNQNSNNTLTINISVSGYPNSSITSNIFTSGFCSAWIYVCRSTDSGKITNLSSQEHSSENIRLGLEKYEFDKLLHEQRTRHED